MIAVSTSIVPDDQQQHARCPAARSGLRAQRAATAAIATKARKPSAGRSAIGLPGGAGASDAAPCDRATSRRPRRPSSPAAMIDRESGSATRVARIATSTMTRRYMTAVASAIPAGSAPARLRCSEPLGERLGDRGRAVGAADHRGGDGPVALAENAVGDIAEEREAGDEHDHQPQLAAGSTRRAGRSGRWAGTAAPRRR